MSRRCDADPARDATYVNSFSSSITGICAPDWPNDDVREFEPLNELLREDDSCCCCSNDAVRDDESVCCCCSNDAVRDDEFAVCSEYDAWSSWAGSGWKVASLP